MALRPPYPAIEHNLLLVQDARLALARAQPEQLAERALPILVDLALAPDGPGRPGHVGGPPSAVSGAKGVHLIPGHPIAGTDHSGPSAGFPELFINRWCVLTPGAEVENAAVSKLSTFWTALGSNVETMDAAHHDMVLAITSHIPHLVAYNIVGTVADLEQDTQSEVIKFSASGFRDFTRIAASDPVMWRDVFLTNRDAVLEMLGRFLEAKAKGSRASAVQTQ